MGCILAVSSPLLCRIYEERAFFVLWCDRVWNRARFSEYSIELCPWPPTCKVSVDNPCWLHQRGNGVRAGEGLSSAASWQQNSIKTLKMRLYTTRGYIEIVVLLDCNDNRLVLTESLPFPQPSGYKSKYLSCGSEKLKVGFSSRHTCTALVEAEVRGLQKSFSDHLEGWIEESGVRIVKRRRVWVLLSPLSEKQWFPWRFREIN